MAETSTIRSSHNDRLILIIKQPYHPASSRTIERWIKQILERWIKQTITSLGIDTTVFSAHNTRHTTTSAAHRAGVSVDVIERLLAGQISLQRLRISITNLLLMDNKLC